MDSQVDSVGAVDLAMPWQHQPPPPPPPTRLFYSSNTNEQSETSHSICREAGVTYETIAEEQIYLQPTVTQNCDNS